jgi:hypothetical protein
LRVRIPPARLAACIRERLYGEEAMAKSKLFARLQEAFRADVVAPEAEYKRHTAEERKELMARAFGLQAEQEEQEEVVADGATA